MDPRHPELAISRLRELMHQYDEIENSMKRATTSAQLAQLEHEGALVVQEICLVAPRIHEAMMQTSRQRRHDLSRGVLIEPQDTAVETPQGGMFEPEIVEELVEKPVEKSMSLDEMVETFTDPVPIPAVENYVAPNQAETVIVEPKPRKRKTAKKKAEK